MDDFRKQQKKECLDGSQNKRCRYGCQCCRKHGDLSKHKRYSRRPEFDKKISETSDAINKICSEKLRVRKQKLRELQIARLAKLRYIQE